MEVERYKEELRLKLLKDLKDLTEKIETNEDLPHSKQNLDLILNISNKIQQCLNNWYY